MDTAAKRELRVEVNLRALDQLKVELEDRAAEIDELKQERDFWRNEYDELLACIGGVVLR
jgi:hypothetical protein